MLLFIDKYKDCFGKDILRLIIKFYYNDDESHNRIQEMKTLKKSYYDLDDIPYMHGVRGKYGNSENNDKNMTVFEREMQEWMPLSQC